MHRASPYLLIIALLASPAVAAQRSVAIISFDRLRVEGPFAVEVMTRATPRATVTGDARALDRVDVHVDGGTLVVRAAAGGWGERPGSAGVAAPTIQLQTRDLRSASLIGGGKLAIAGPIAAERVDLVVTGGGSLRAPQISAGQLSATLIGTGAMELGGTARSARLSANGAGQIAAAALTAGDVVVRTEGAAAATVTARFTATAGSSGLGPIEILGRPECKGKALAGGPITCGGKPL